MSKSRGPSCRRAPPCEAPLGLRISYFKNKEFLTSNCLNTAFCEILYGTTTLYEEGNMYWSSFCRSYPTYQSINLSIRLTSVPLRHNIAPGPYVVWFLRSSTNTRVNRSLFMQGSILHCFIKALGREEVKLGHSSGCCLFLVIWVSESFEPLKKTR